MNLQALKIISIIIHGVVALGGLFLFGATVYIMANPAKVMTVMETETVTAISAYTCGLAIIIIAVALLGFIGAWTESPKILKIFVAVVIICLVIEINALVVPFGMRRRWEDKFNDQLFAIMDKYGLDQYPFLTEMWDDFQSTMECCGSYKAEDWSFSPYVQQEFYPVMIPPSCCKSFNDEAGVKAKCVRRNDTELYYTKGCLTVTKELIWSYSTLIGAAAFVIFGTQIFVIIISILLMKECEDEEVYNEEPGEYELAPSSAIQSFKPIVLPQTERPSHNGSEGSGGKDDDIEI